MNQCTDRAEILPKARKSLSGPKYKILMNLKNVCVIYRPETAKIILVCKIHASDAMLLIFSKYLDNDHINIMTKFEGISFCTLRDIKEIVIFRPFLFWSVKYTKIILKKCKPVYFESK